MPFSVFSRNPISSASIRLLIYSSIFTMTVAKNAFEGTPIFDRYPPSGINILIVGAGLGGLAFAIEAHRKGHDVHIIDRRAHFNDYGRLIIISNVRSPKAKLTTYRRFHRNSALCVKNT